MDFQDAFQPDVHPIVFGVRSFCMADSAFSKSRRGGGVDDFFWNLCRIFEKRTLDDSHAYAPFGGTAFYPTDCRDRFGLPVPARWNPAGVVVGELILQSRHLWALMIVR